MFDIYRPDWRDQDTMNYFMTNCDDDPDNKIILLNAYCKSRHCDEGDWFQLIMDKYGDDMDIDWYCVIMNTSFGFIKKHMDFFMSHDIDIRRHPWGFITIEDYEWFMITYLHEQKQDYESFNKFWKLSYYSHNLRNNMLIRLRNMEQVSTSLLLKLKRWYINTYGRNDWNKHYYDNYHQYVDLDNPNEPIHMFTPGLCILSGPV